MNSNITLFTETVIDSCHHLENYIGKCSNLHGHSWLIQIWIQGEDSQKDEVGILFDFGSIKDIKEELDHKHINKEIKFFNRVNPTAENLSRYILSKLVDKDSRLDYRVRIYETAVGKDTYAQRQTDNFDINYL